jgi:hypothetical protein
MEVPASVQFNEDLHLFVWKPRGILDEASVNKVLVDLVRYECRASQPFNRFSDLSEVQDFHLTFKYVFHVALHRRLAYAGREPVKSVFFRYPLGSCSACENPRYHDRSLALEGGDV